MLKIRAIKIDVNTDSGLFGANFCFKSGLNIVRGNNTSGKSSLFQSILYCLGLEELIGGTNEKTMQSVLKEVVEYPVNSFHKVLQSFVFLEIENSQSEVITIARSVISSIRKPQLVDVYKGALISEPTSDLRPQPMFVHSHGGATDELFGFHKFLEMFLGWELPLILNQFGEDKRLYFQQVASAFIIEQKSGWSDFLATMPHYGLKNKEARVIEFLLKLDVFKNKRKRQQTYTKKKIIEEGWYRLYKQFLKISDRGAAKLYGLETKPSIINDYSKISLTVTDGEEEISIPIYIERQLEVLSEFEEKSVPKIAAKIKEYEKEIDNLNNEINTLSLNYDLVVEELSFDKDKLVRYEGQLASLNEDLRKNRGALKVKKLGADVESKVAQDLCPTCEQPIKDSLLPGEISQTPMNLEENLSFIDAQIKMLDVYIEGQKHKIKEKEKRIVSFRDTLSKNRQRVRVLRKELISDERLPSEAEIEKKLNIKKRVEFYTKLLDDFNDLLTELETLSDAYETVLADEKRLSKDYFSATDREKLTFLLEQFKRLLIKFDYKSKSNDSVNLSLDNYLPVAQKPFGEGDMKNYDLRFDSSASDFIRCIWAYSCSLHLTSESYGLNHPKLMMFDEPKQQDISIEHFRSFLAELSQYNGAQTLVFASFENSDTSFKAATEGLDFELNYIDKKLIMPIQRQKG